MSNILALEDMTNLKLEFRDSDIVERVIHEVEMMIIKPALGDATYIALIADEVDSDYNTLLNGGTYEVDGKSIHFAGLKLAIGYYTAGKLINTNIQQTRFGSIEKKSDNGNNASLTERQRQKRDFFMIADNALKDCVKYLDANIDTFEGFKAYKFINHQSLVFKIIGD